MMFNKSSVCSMTNLANTSFNIHETTVSHLKKAKFIDLFIKSNKNIESADCMQQAEWLDEFLL